MSASTKRTLFNLCVDAAIMAGLVGVLAILVGFKSLIVGGVMFMVAIALARFAMRKMRR